MNIGRSIKLWEEQLVTWQIRRAERSTWEVHGYWLSSSHWARSGESSLNMGVKMLIEIHLFWLVGEVLYKYDVPKLSEFVPLVPQLCTTQTYITFFQKRFFTGTWIVEIQQQAKKRKATPPHYNSLIFNPSYPHHPIIVLMVLCLHSVTKNYQCFKLVMSLVYCIQQPKAKVMIKNIYKKKANYPDQHINLNALKLLCIRFGNYRLSLQ